MATLETMSRQVPVGELEWREQSRALGEIYIWGQKNKEESAKETRSVQECGINSTDNFYCALTMY